MSRNPYHVRTFYDEEVARWAGMIVAGPVCAETDSVHPVGYILHDTRAQVVALAEASLGYDVECVLIADPTQPPN